MDEPEGDPTTARNKIDSPKTYLHVRPYPDRHVRSNADTAWLVDAGSRRVVGIFNATGQTVPLSGHLDVARTVGSHTGPIVAADQQWLLTQGVQEWMGERSLPLWLADPDWLGFNANDSSKARGAGLITRPLDQTLSDTLDWEMSRDRDRLRRAGLSDEDERTLLTALGRT